MTATNDEPTAQDAGGQNPKHDEGYKYILSKAANFLHFLKKYIICKKAFIFEGF